MNAPRQPRFVGGMRDPKRWPPDSILEPASARGTEGSNPVTSSGESGANLLLIPITQTAAGPDRIARHAINALTETAARKPARRYTLGERVEPPNCRIAIRGG